MVKIFNEFCFYSAIKIPTNFFTPKLNCKRSVNERLLKCLMNTPQGFNSIKHIYHQEKFQSYKFITFAHKLIAMKITLPIIIAFVVLVQNVRAQENLNIKWYTLEEALELNAKQPRKIFIDIYTDWCGWCKVMDKNTFSNQYIADYLSKNFYPVKLNAEGTNDITYKGQVFKNRGQGQRPIHDLAVALLQGKLSYPSVVFLDSGSNPITFLSGYLTPEQLEPILAFIADDHFKTEQWETFRAKFVSKLPK